MDDPLDFDAQEQALVQQQARIKALRQIAGQPIEQAAMSPGWTSAVTGTHIGGQVTKTPTAALLNPLIGNIGAEIGDSVANSQRSDLSRAEQADYQKWIAGQPQAQTGAIATNPSNNLVEAQPGATVLPTRNEILQHAALGNRNPLSRAVAAKLVEDQLVAAPTREAAAAIAAQNTQWDRNFKLLGAAETARHHGVTENQGGKGSWSDSGLVDRSSGSKIYNNFSTMETGRMNADGTVTVTGKMPAGTQPPASSGTGGVTTSGATGGDAVRPPTQLDAGTRNKINDNMTNATTLQDLRGRYNPEVHSGVKSTLLNSSPLANALGKTGVLGDNAQESAAYWSDVQAYSNQVLRSLSGTAVTESEMGRFKQAMPGPSSSPKVVQDWFDRSEKLANVVAAREQALADKGAKMDIQRGVVVGPDGKDVPGTESPFPAAGKGARITPPEASRAAPATATVAPTTAVPRVVPPADQAQRNGDAKMVLQSELSKAQQRALEIPQEMAAEKDPRKVRELQAEMSRNAADIEGIQREIGRMPGSSMPKTNALPRSNPPPAKELTWNPATKRLE